MLLAGEIDAWIAGRDAPKMAEIVPIVPNADRAALEWFDRVKAFPINHMAVVTREIVDRHPWLPAELFGLLKRNKEAYLKELAAMPSSSDADEEFKRRVFKDGIDPLPFGVEALRRSLEVVIGYAYAQQLIPRRFSVDEIFDPRVRSLV
jgi:4,5-dihydroxyphthalate decarboxylase